MKTENPKVEADSITRAKDGVWDIKVRCPHCGETHRHGGGDDPDGALLGHRQAHCGRGGYEITRRPTS